MKKVKNQKVYSEITRLIYFDKLSIHYVKKMYSSTSHLFIYKSDHILKVFSICPHKIGSADKKNLQYLNINRGRYKY